MIKVAKFGGSSVADEKGFNAVADWLQKDKDIKAVVLSAGGKTKTCKKVTDLLIDAYKKIEDGAPISVALLDFNDRVRFDAEKVGLKNFIDNQLKKIEQEIENNLSFDFILSRGEFVYANLFAKFYGVRFVDSATLIKFNENGLVNYGYCQYKIKEEYEKNGFFITGGFYGSYQNGKVKTFSRGGGDFSGAIVSKGLLASEYLNFTDVDGVYQFDPKIVDNGVIDELSFDLVRILSEFGAGVLHPASVLPLYGENISIRVKNTFNKHFKGTLILENTTEKTFAVALKRGVKFLKVKRRGYGYDILKECYKNLKVICSANTLDTSCVCYEGDFSVESFAEKFLTEYAVENGLCSFFYLSDSERSKRIITAVENNKIALFTVSFKIGYYVVVDAKNEYVLINLIGEK